MTAIDSVPPDSSPALKHSADSPADSVSRTESKWAGPLAGGPVFKLVATVTVMVSVLASESPAAAATALSALDPGPGFD